MYTDKEDGIELVSFSTLIGIYLSVWDSIIEYVTDNIPIKILFYIQIGISSFVILVTLIALFIFLFILDLFWATFLYLLSFFFAFGGIWFCKCFKKHNFYKKCTCCNDIEICCSKGSCQERCTDCLECIFLEKNIKSLNQRIKDNDN